MRHPHLNGSARRRLPPGGPPPGPYSLDPWSRVWNPETSQGPRNPYTYNGIAITPGTPTNVPVLSGNDRRRALILQNNSYATVAGDIAPLLFIGFNSQAEVGNFAVSPGGGAFYFDIVPPRDAIFVLWGASTNPGGSVVVQGAVVQGMLEP